VFWIGSRRRRGGGLFFKMVERFEVDLANQIDNKWTKDTILAMKNRNFGFSVKIKSSDKKILKKKFISELGDKSDRKHNKKVVVMIYSFLIFKLITLNKEWVKAVSVCRDYEPLFLVSKSLSKICKFYKDEPVTNYISLRFKRNKKKKSRAHRLANDVLRVRKKEDYCLTARDLEKLEEVIRKNL